MNPHYKKITIAALGLALIVAIALSGNHLKEAQANHDDAVSNKKRTLAQLELDEYAECVTGVELANIKLAEYYEGNYELQEGETVDSLQALAEQECAHPTTTAAEKVDSGLYYVFSDTADVYVSQNPQQHFANNRYLATDISTNGQKLWVMAPSWDYIDAEGEYYDEAREYTVKIVENYGTMGLTVELHWDEDGKHMNWAIGHMYELTVNDGDIVKTGERVGTSGGCPGELKLNEVSTGCHIHLELRQDGTAIDYPTYKNTLHGEDLDAYRKYKEKHKPVDEYGDVLQAHLNKHAADEFKDANMWREIGKEYGIHSAFLVAIAQADTSIGKKTLTKWNVGNVGNADRGCLNKETKCEFNSPREGVEAIAATLNNQYFKSMTKIGELSNGGRTTLGLPACGVNGAKCYASSADTWNSNVKIIVGQLTGATIDENWNFRL